MEDAIGKDRNSVISSDGSSAAAMDASVEQRKGGSTNDVDTQVVERGVGQAAQNVHDSEQDHVQSECNHHASGRPCPQQELSPFRKIRDVHFGRTNFVQNGVFTDFWRLVLGCMDSYDNESRRIFQHFLSST